LFPELFGGFTDLPYPDPYLAAEDSFYKEGTMIYKPEHFSPLRNQIVKILELLATEAARKTAS
jgi:hypothetical protein